MPLITDETFLSLLADDMRDNGVEDEDFIRETVDAIRVNSINKKENNNGI